jgi:RNA polymerase sigma-70 factor (ECF subfamily)
MLQGSIHHDDVSLLLEAQVRRFAGLLRHARRRYGLHSGDLDELVQEVRLRLWRAQRTPASISAVSPSYMYRVAMSAAVDLIRRRRHEARGPSVSDRTGRPTEEAAPPTWDPAEASELSRRLERAIGALSPAREVAVRLHLAGYPREEIAMLMGWTEPKTRNLIYRGLSELRDRLAELGVGPPGVQ